MGYEGFGGIRGLNISEIKKKGWSFMSINSVIKVWSTNMKDKNFHNLLKNRKSK